MSPQDGHLLMMSLGPIQDFIHSARRCQDLWFGSWLLSDLARAVGDTVGKVATSVVFPARADRTQASRGGEPPGVANIIIAVLPFDVRPKELAAECRTALLNRLHEIRDHAWSSIPDYAIRHFQRGAAVTQVDDLMELEWVAVPLAGLSYASARKEAVRQMASIKNTRMWSQPPWRPRPGIPKSSLDGNRESVIHEAAYGSVRESGLTQQQRRRAFGTKKGERLCGVGLLKRLGSMIDENGDARRATFIRGRPRFHSTPHLAMAPTAARVNRWPDKVAAWLSALEDAGVDLARYRVEKDSTGATGGPPGLRPIRDAHKGDFDGVLLMETRIPEVLEDAGADPQHAGGLATQLRHLLRETDGPSEPCPYYAFLLADGDNMGAAIDALDSVDKHQKLGHALNEFAGSCRAIVSKHEGTLIFAGGDDVLALLPLDRALDCASELNSTFANVVEGALKSLAPGEHGRPAASLSVGIGISHCREPMSEARALAQRAERLAKQVPGKNALCVLVDKRSGGELQVTGSWARTDGRPSLAEAVQAWIAVVESGGLAAKAAHDIEAVAAHYEREGTSGGSPLGSEPSDSLRAAEAASLLHQVLRRKRGQGGQSRSGEADRLLDHRLRAMEGEVESAEPEGSLRQLSQRIRQLSAELQLARLICAARRDRRGLGPVLDTDAAEDGEA